jgi:FMN phosphatase YigB (HAD superfamily)
MDRARVLLFDLDNTLIDRAVGFRAWTADFLLHHGHSGEQEVEWVEAQDEDGLASRRVFFERLKQRYALAASVDSLVLDYRRELLRFLPPPTEATVDAIRTARKGAWRIGIVTNGSALQEIKITSSELADLADGWCISGIVGCRKPDPDIFRLAAELCGSQLHGAWMVGDGVRSDIAGALAAGIDSIWISRGRSWDEVNYRPTVIANSVPEAVEHILTATP